MGNQQNDPLVVGILLLLTALFAVVDYSMQYRHLRKQLMMSREDIKQEFKTRRGARDQAATQGAAPGDPERQSG